MGKRPTRKDKLLATARALMGKHYDQVSETVGLGVPYRFKELDGKPTGHNTDSTRGVILIWCGADDIVYRAELGTR